MNKDFWKKSPNIFIVSNNNKYILFHRVFLQAFEVDSETIDILKTFSNRQYIGQGDIDCPKIKELIKHNILINQKSELIENEYKNAIYSNKIQTRFNYFRIVLTEACNLNCRYCFVVNNRNKVKTMNQNTLFRKIDQIISVSDKNDINIHWFGGEPLLAFDLLRKGVEYLHYHLLKGSFRSIHHSITTNGTKITKEIAEYFKIHNFNVAISIDGNKQVNDINRRSINGNSTFASVVNGYKLLQDYKISSGFLLTPHKTTQNSLYNSVKYLYENYRCRHIGINTPQPTKKGWDIDGKKFAKEMLKITVYCMDNQIRLSSVCQRIALSLSKKKPFINDCIDLNGNMGVSLTPEGKFTACIVAWDESVPSGRFYNNFFKKIQDWKLADNKHIKCKNCIAQMICGGPCALEKQICGMNIERCLFYQTYLKGILFL